MNILHIVPGLDDPTCGIAVAAKMIARRQRASGKSVECVDFRAWMTRQIADADEVWVHSMWTPGVMMAAWTALRMGKKLVRMPHGCMDPVKVRHHWWKKMWVAPIERWLFGKADRVVATCEDEMKWIREFEPKVKNVEMLSLSECVDFSRVGCVDRVGDADGSLRLLFIGRLHPLKGVEFLLGAMNEISRRSKSKLKCGSSCFLSSTSTKDFNFSIKLRVIGKDEGEGDKLRQMAKDYGLNVEFCGVVSEEEKEREWAWCDVLVLPTLSENFGLVVAEALERGKRVITTDGAPVWESSSRSYESKLNSGVGNSVDERDLPVRCSTSTSDFDSNILSGYDGRLIYLKGYRDGSDEKRVALLKMAIEILGGADISFVKDDLI